MWVMFHTTIKALFWYRCIAFFADMRHAFYICFADKCEIMNVIIIDNPFFIFKI